MMNCIRYFLFLVVKLVQLKMLEFMLLTISFSSILPNFLKLLLFLLPFLLPEFFKLKIPFVFTLFFKFHPVPIGLKFDEL